jgi:signal transduction histidine kinase
MVGLFAFLLLASVCLYAVWSLNDYKSIQAITPICVFAFILSLLGGIFAAYASKTPARLQQLVLERTAALDRDITERKKAENELIKSEEYLRQLSNYLEDIREEERLNIAKEIHDELGQQLTVLKINVSRLGKKVTAMEDTLATEIHELLDLIDKMIETARKISSELRPGMLDDIGLTETLDWYCDDFSNRTGIKTAFISAITDDKFPQKLNTGIFRIFQESLNNAAKHSEAKKVDVSLFNKTHQLVLLIEDNGKGFDTSEDNNKTPGILVMKERARMMSGTYNISSTPGKGTIIEVSVPLNNPD